ncbi:MAG: hypothetical protein IJM37_02905 [Lachnospiraceae bacterium]|nr:hypothetical protein [Lachnospiraceae bacterium]
MSKIEEIIVEIENYVESCKPAPFSGNRKIVVDKDDIQDLLVQLKMRTPEEIKKYQKIVSNKDAILANAKAQAEAIVEDAKRQKEALINESVIKQDAEAQAKDIIKEAQEYSKVVREQANDESNAIKVSAIEYTDSLLAHVQEVIVNSLEGYRNNYENMVNTLQTDYETIMANRNELIADDGTQEQTDASVNNN